MQTIDCPMYTQFEKACSGALRYSSGADQKSSVLSFQSIGERDCARSDGIENVMTAAHFLS